VPFAILNLIHANGPNRSEDTMLQSPADQIGYRVVNLVPGGPKLFGGFFPGEFARPMSQECMWTTSLPSKGGGLSLSTGQPALQYFDLPGRADNRG